MKFLSFSEAMHEQFGTKVYKLSLSSGCTCPNRDGTVGFGGCTFCSEGGSGEFAAPFRPLPEQIQIAREKVDAKIPASIPQEERLYIAYFQSFTNTYMPVSRLRQLLEETLAQPQIAAVSLGTRPDCLEDEKIGLLQEMSRIRPIWVELGLQTMHDRTAETVHRGYPTSVFADACRRLQKAGIPVIVHLIFGLPGETREDMLASVRYVAGFRPAGVKLQLLQILRGTKIAEQYLRDPFPIMDLDAYCRLIVDSLQILPPDTVIHRLTGDGPKKLLIAPLWCGDKKRVINTLYQFIERN